MVTEADLLEEGTIIHDSITVNRTTISHRTILVVSKMNIQAIRNMHSRHNQSTNKYTIWMGKFKSKFSQNTKINSFSISLDTQIRSSQTHLVHRA